MRALILDLRVSPNHRVYAAVGVVLVVICGVAGTLTPLWLLASLWLGSSLQTHQEMAPFGRLQSVLGIPRGEAVTARYLVLVVVTGGIALAGCLVGLVWWWQGRDLVSLWGLFAVQVMVLLVGCVVLTLGYAVSPAARQWGSIGLIVLVVGIGLTPLWAGRDASTRALVDTLYAGPVSIVGVVAVAAVVAGVVGRKLSLRAYSREAL